MRLRFLIPLAALSLAGCVGDGQGPDAALTPQQQARASEALNVPAPEDELARAKTHFREREFGLAERGFRAVIEKSPNDIEAWLGLAACHDQLGRFDLADKEYAQASKRGGVNFELLNNRGYSYMMRGDLRRARVDFSAAQRLGPDSEFVRNNLIELQRRGSGQG